jgi:hypothetical protein
MVQVRSSDDDEIMTQPAPKATIDEVIQRAKSSDMQAVERDDSKQVQTLSNRESGVVLSSPRRYSPSPQNDSSPTGVSFASIARLTPLAFVSSVEYPKDPPTLQAIVSRRGPRNHPHDISTVRSYISKRAPLVMPTTLCTHPQTSQTSRLLSNSWEHAAHNPSGSRHSFEDILFQHDLRLAYMVLKYIQGNGIVRFLGHFR